jgi:hypothetical protein
VKRPLLTICTAGALLLAGCSGGGSDDCQEVPAAFFSDIDARGDVIQSGAVKSGTQTANGRDVYMVAARFSDGVAVWSTGGSIVGGGPTFPMNEVARTHSDQGVDAPTSAIPDDPDGVSNAQQCVEAPRS